MGSLFSRSGAAARQNAFNISMNQAQESAGIAFQEVGTGISRRYPSLSTDDCNRLAARVMNQLLEVPTPSGSPPITPEQGEIVNASCRDYEIVTQATRVRVSDYSCGLGQYSMKEGHLPNARHHFEVAIRLNGHSWISMAQLANVFEGMGLTAEARKYARMAMQIQPDVASFFPNLV